ncbi:hypothetical protein ABIF21_000035 [Bradyrhizobium elkanii]|uniref:hypothetical protein n=1 Tax=Bradyrhizobium elkanii TaxID=29448 RepID=UPI00101EF1A4|nr:hypothetical protein [Bradyrhizobium elkanii]NWL40369.1 hypothetical protein [Bradyrhizobium elkanii]RYM21112.1 hypothetical protein EWH13_28275 [Bradyrhizobium elkanii]
MTSAKRRPRRIAADEAHSWARHLRLRNPGAKDVLKNLTIYVDGEGCCWVGIPSLAEDLEMSPDTIRRRLAWLEMVGAISREAQWIDEYGVRNGQQRGRRTTDKIRLLFEADVDAIEARAAGETVDAENDAVSTASDPSKLRGSDPPAGTRLGLGRPSQSCEGLISEPEPEPESPQAPGGGEREPLRDEEVESEPEHFAETWDAWPAKLRRDLALAEFCKLPPDKARLCRAAVPHFLAMLKRLRRDHVPNLNIFIRSRDFEQFPTATLDEGPKALQGSYDAEGREGRAIKALYRFGRGSLWENRGKVTYPLPITAGVLAFADLPAERDWHWIETPAQLFRWSAFLNAHIHGRRADLMVMRGVGADARRGFMAPHPWPPRKDGTWSSDESGESE